MAKRPLLLVAAVAAVLAAALAPIAPQVAGAATTASAIVARSNPPAPRTGAKALRVLSVNVIKLARDYKHQRYHAVCTHLTKKELKHLGNMADCTLQVALINALVPVKKFTITSAKFNKTHAKAVVSLYVNGAKKHRIRTVVKWDGGAYRLDQMSGWKPGL